METFRWLHLTDLHWGSNDHRSLWGSLESSWFKDIDKLQKKCGGTWDAIFFTGDLVNTGQESEFNGLTKRLSRLYTHLNEGGSNPFLLAVPGNHDLVRPVNKKPLAFKALTNSWDSDSDIRDIIWKKDHSHECWEIINKAFENYSNWYEEAKKEFPVPPGIKQGLLPGEFAVSIDKGQHKIGVLGLNTTFLQLQEGNFKGRLDADPEQIIELFGQDFQDWEKECDVCLLLTHHPMDWFSTRGQDAFETVIAPPGRFGVHLFGHQHDSESTYIQLGGSSETRRTVCGCSLFSIEKYRDWQGNIDKNRRHGYSAGCFQFEETQLKLRIWPRLGNEKQDKAWGFNGDSSFHLGDDDAYGTAIALKHRETKRNVLPDRQVKKRKKNIEEKNISSSSESIFELLIRQLMRLLSGEHLETLKLAFTGQLNEKRDEECEYSIKEIAGLLVYMEPLEAVSLVCETMEDCCETNKGNEGFSLEKEFILNCCESIVSWLVLRCVDEKWAENTSREIEEKGNDMKLFIPVKHEPSAHIAYYRVQRKPVLIQLDENKWEISSKTGIPLEQVNLESGPAPSISANTIKNALLKRLNPLIDVKDFSTDMDEQLDHTLNKLRKKSKYYYLAVDTTKKEYGSLDDDVYNELNNKLECFTIIFLGHEEHDMIPIPFESKLQVELRFFHNALLKYKEEK